MFLYASGSWEDLTVTEVDTREYVLWGRWERGRERINPDREKEEQERRQVGRRPSLLVTGSHWMNSAVCTILKNIFNESLDSQAHFH